VVFLVSKGRAHPVGCRGAQGTATESGGAWSASIALSVQGSNAITAQATDLAGNTGTSVADTLTLDTSLAADRRAGTSNIGRSPLGSDFLYSFTF
jgi:hypothetical protein